jgi:NifU-like protein
VGEVGSLACGDALKLTFKLDEGGAHHGRQVQDVRLRQRHRDSSSVLTELIKGKTLDEAMKVTNRDIAEYLGGLPEQKMHCSVMGQRGPGGGDRELSRRRNGRRRTSIDHAERIVCTCFGVTDQGDRAGGPRERPDHGRAGDQLLQGRRRLRRLQGRDREDHPVRSKASEVKEQMLAASPARASKLTTIQKIQLVQQTVNEQVRPALRAHGGNIELIDVEGDKVIIAFRGMCAQCKISEFTMRDVVEAKLREFVSRGPVRRGGQGFSQRGPRA